MRVADARARGCRLLLANGDISNEVEPDAVTEARRTLDVFGQLGRGANRILGPNDDHAYFVTRGNHDRAHAGELHAKCSSVERGAGT